tara:strand:+ start:332 stop:445 length:114 start_codon:yes stop_codon:yes gene_type:complete
MVDPTVFTELWFCSYEGHPNQIENTRKLDSEIAIKHE